jgi:hypothetical protein
LDLLRSQLLMKCGRDYPDPTKSEERELISIGYHHQAWETTKGMPEYPQMKKALKRTYESLKKVPKDPL